MIDMHLHILPGVDDGAQSMRESLEMARIAVASGVDRVIATPHCGHPYRSAGYSAARLKERAEEFRRELAARQIPLAVYDGMEIFVNEYTGDMIRAGQYHGLNYGKYYLIEFPFDAEPSWIDDRLNEIASPDVIPLIAHVERYICVQDDPFLVYHWLRGGCEIQVNQGSFFGDFGAAARRAADYALNNGLITCIASDAHDAARRTTDMKDIEEYLKKRYNNMIPKLLLEEYPERVLNSQPIPKHGQRP